MMPEMDGYEVLQHLKSNPETTDIPVIIMSALSDMQSIVKGYQLGATEYVTKPFQREELVEGWPTATSFTASSASRPSWRTRSSLTGCGPNGSADGPPLTPTSGARSVTGALGEFGSAGVAFGACGSIGGALGAGMFGSPPVCRG